MLQKTTTLGVLALLLAGALAAVQSDAVVERPARPDVDAEAVARWPGADVMPARTSALAAPDRVAAEIPAAPGGAATLAIRTPREPVAVAIDEGARNFVDDAVRFATAGNLRGDAWTPGDVILRVLNGRADLAIACREPTPGEERRGLVGERIGDLIAVLVTHPSNPVSDLEADAVRGLVRGSVSDWSQVGGRAGSVHLVLPPPGPQSDLFARLLARGDKLARSATSAPTDEERLRIVASDPNAIAVVTLEAARRAHVGTLRIDGVPPGPGAVQVRRYPFATQVTLVHRGDDQAARVGIALRDARARRMLGAHLTLDE